MIRNIKRTYFEIWGTEEAQNSFLKGLLLTLTVLFVVQATALTCLVLRKPVLIAVGENETKVFAVAPPSDELLRDELKRVVRDYVEAHYNWEPATIEKAHATASQYVEEKYVKNFQMANAEQVRFAKEKKVSQKIYVSLISVDPKSLVARVTMDRILMVEGLRATSPFVLDVNFQYGPRTDKNPTGIYVTGEKVITGNATGGG